MQAGKKRLTLFGFASDEMLSCTYNFRQELENLAPSVEKFVEVARSGRVRGVIVTLRGSAENGCVDETGRVYDFVSRYFTPWNGINEDPVCGALPQHHYH